MTAMHLRVQRNYLPEEKCRAGSTSLRACFTVSLSGGRPVLCLGVVVCLFFGAVFVVFVLSLVFPLLSI